MSPLADINAAFLFGWILGTFFTVITGIVCWCLIRQLIREG